MQVRNLSPTSQDIENARIRRQIAERQGQEYEECLRWAVEAFGSGWEPSGRHYLIEKDEEERARATGERPTAAAKVFTVKNAAGEKRYFTVVNGRAVEHASHEAAFGDMLLELHPTRGFEHRGKFCRIQRYILCWGSFELYHPKTAVQLAKARARREERAIEKAAQDNPLFAEQIRARELGLTKKPRKTSRAEEGG